MIDKSGAPAAPMMMMPIPHNLGRCDRKACAENRRSQQMMGAFRADDTNRVSVSRFDSGQKNTFSDGR
jgi:hypothetical protein